MFPIRNGLKQGYALSPLLFNSALEYTIMKAQVKQGGLKLNGKYQLLVYADDVNILGGSVHTIEENRESLVVASKEIGLEVNADKPKYMAMFWDQNAGRSHSIKISELIHSYKGGWVQIFWNNLNNSKFYSGRN